MDECSDVKRPMSLSKDVHAKLPLKQFEKLELLKEYGFIKNYASYCCDAIIRSLKENEKEGDFEYIRKQKELRDIQDNDRQQPEESEMRNKDRISE